MTLKIESGFAPVQWKEYGGIPATVYLRAYEVYRHCYGEQKAMIEGPCRGGFSSGELLAFLYARTFPQSEWQARVDEAFKRAASEVKG